MFEYTLLAFQRRKQKVAGGAVACIGIKLTPHSLERRRLFTCVPLPPQAFSGWLCLGRAVLFCSAQEMLLLLHPLCVVRPWGVFQAQATCFRVFAESGIFKLTNTEFVSWLQTDLEQRLYKFQESWVLMFDLRSRDASLKNELVLWFV